MSNAFLDALHSKPYLILDGALATELESKGCNLNCKLWSAQALADTPHLIYQTHLEYFQAGADIAITSTYQASLSGLIDAGYSDADAFALMKKSVDLAQRARDEVVHQDPSRTCFIAGSVGPYGAYLSDGSEYRGDYSLSSDDMMTFHRSRIQALVDAGVDVLACETIPSFAEIKALTTLLDEFGTPAWISVTLKDGQHLSDGTPLDQVAASLDQSSAVVAIGVNCVSPTMVDDALCVFSRKSRKPLVVYPNSGEGFDATTKTWTGSPLDMSTLAHAVHRWHAIGARLFGGCCRTTPSVIKKIALALKATEKNS